MIQGGAHDSAGVDGRDEERQSFTRDQLGPVAGRTEVTRPHGTNTGRPLTNLSVIPTLRLRSRSKTSQRDAAGNVKGFPPGTKIGTRRVQCAPPVSRRTPTNSLRDTTSGTGNALESTSASYSMPHHRPKTCLHPSTSASLEWIQPSSAFRSMSRTTPII